ncbi:MAG: hypothetical protein KDD55_04655 [Bdellovibrionales bacterium]|nr:hypothetical protein [Bdellovibrionales bacterium]
MEQSHQVQSSQLCFSSDTEWIVRRHLTHQYLKPIPQRSRDCFAEIINLLDEHDGPLILDSGCGVGESTLRLASQYPQALVIGIDKSAVRTRRFSHYKNSLVMLTGEALLNVHIFRADVTDIWRLLAEHSISINKHVLFYPTPWPKPKHFKRRWHGHPVFPTLVQISDSIELRSNWRPYVEEFALAVDMAGTHQGEILGIDPQRAISPFERKYLTSGHLLYVYRCSRGQLT